jgi:hypothetical protein
MLTGQVIVFLLLLGLLIPRRIRPLTMLFVQQIQLFSLVLVLIPESRLDLLFISKFIYFWQFLFGLSRNSLLLPNLPTEKHQNHPIFN